MKIPFDIKYRPQVESGEYKVETRDGRSVRIICWDRVAKDNTDADLNICVLVPEENGEAVYYYHQSGKKWVRDEGFDLFLITPEPALTEFEEKVKQLIGTYPVATRENQGSLIYEVRKAATELLELAKSEALKDLPRWKKWRNGACSIGRGIPLAIVKQGLNSYELVDALGIPGEQYIMLSDLKKLPGLKED